MVSLQVECRELKELDVGAIRLTVPLLDDVIQVGIGGRYPTGVIEVCKTRDAVRVRRIDGRPVQVHIVRDWQGPNSPGTRSAVLRHGVAVLTFHRRSPRGWAADGLPIRRPADLKAFIGTIARFALAKQRRPGQLTA